MENESVSLQDYRLCDRVWQRVAPQLDPYPDVRAALRREGELPRPTEWLGSPELPKEELSCPVCTEERELLRAFIEGELEDRQTYLSAARHAPAAARQTLRRMAEEEGEHARRLMAAYFLLTGENYRPAVQTPQPQMPRWRELLRRRWREELRACRNYRKAGERTHEESLGEIFSALSEQEHCHAKRLMLLLEQSLA